MRLSCPSGLMYTIQPLWLGINIPLFPSFQSDTQFPGLSPPLSVTTLGKKTKDVHTVEAGADTWTSRRCLCSFISH